MKEKKFDKDAIKIYKAIEPRIAELWVKLTKGNYNHATQYAFEIGCFADIDHELKRIKRNHEKKKR